MAVLCCKIILQEHQIATALDATPAQILGAAIVGLLNGELTDETIAAVDTINRDDVPEPLRDVVSYMHGMSTMPQLRHSIVKDLLMELAAGCRALADEMAENVPPGSF